MLSGELFVATAPPFIASLFSNLEAIMKVFLLLSASSIAPPSPIARLLLIKILMLISFKVTSSKQIYTFIYSLFEEAINK